MAEDTERPMSSTEMIRRAREDLEAKKSDGVESSSPVPVGDMRDRPRVDPARSDKTWRNPVPPSIPQRRSDSRVRQSAYARTPVPVPPTQAPPSASRAAALVVGILVALVGFGVALAVALANGGG